MFSSITMPMTFYDAILVKNRQNINFHKFKHLWLHVEAVGHKICITEIVRKLHQLLLLFYD